MHKFGLFFMTCGILAQSSFEVASVKPNHSASSNSGTNSSRAHFRAENASLRSLILRAYDIRDTQLIGGPAWIETERWDVDARPESELPRGEPGNESMRAMLRSLLADRFHLVAHKEQREMSVYALTVAKGGPKLIASTPAENSGTSSGNGTVKATNISLAELARTLTDQAGRVVIDQTGVPGNFDLQLEFAPENGKEVDRPTLFTALQEQLGLKLESRKAPVDVIVIDKVERATEN